MNSKTRQAILDSVDFFYNVASKEKLEFALKNCDTELEREQIISLQDKLKSLKEMALSILKTDK